MKDDIYKQAKEMFFKYQGNSFFMERDHLYKTFKNYNVPQHVLADWYKALLENNKNRLLSASNNSDVVVNFFVYLDLIRCNSQYFSASDIDFAFDFFSKNEKLDDYSKIKIIEILINFIKYKKIADDRIKKYCKEVLSKMDINSFTVDKSYNDNGQLPSDVLKENIAPRILKDLEQISML
jgi:hypothetical protein